MLKIWLNFPKHFHNKYILSIFGTTESEQAKFLENTPPKFISPTFVLNYSAVALSGPVLGSRCFDFTLSVGLYW